IWRRQGAEAPTRRDMAPPRRGGAKRKGYNEGVIGRRGFLLLLGAGAAAGAASLWLPQTGLVTIPSRFVVDRAGACSCCGKGALEISKLIGVAGRKERICDECIGLCLDILSEAPFPQPRQPIAPPPLREKPASPDEFLAKLRTSDPEELVAA